MGRKLVKLAGILLSLTLFASLTSCVKTQSGSPSNTTSTTPPRTTSNPTPSQKPGSTSSARPGTGNPSSAISQSTTVSGRGTVAFAMFANLYFNSGGKIEKLGVKEGDRVTQGTVLAKLDTTPAWRTL